MSTPDEIIARAKRVCEQQAKDESLWFPARYITEAYLQRALRQLTAIIENDPVDMAIYGDKWEGVE